MGAVCATTGGGNLSPFGAASGRRRRVVAAVASATGGCLPMTVRIPANMPADAIAASKIATIKRVWVNSEKRTMREIWRMAPNFPSIAGSDVCSALDRFIRSRGPVLSSASSYSITWQYRGGAGFYPQQTKPVAELPKAQSDQIQRLLTAGCQEPCSRISSFRNRTRS
jgi:hypothetical protein